MSTAVRSPIAWLSIACLLAVPVGSAAAAERVETPIVSRSPQTDVAASVVRIRVALPATAAPHPDACDWLQYERFRSTTGPADPMQADAVTVLMPGIMEGATAFDPLARNAVREAKRRGRSVEVWALDRRSNCLEDLTGLNKMEATGNFQDAFGYYFGKQPIDGRTFGGWEPDDHVLADIGLAQTVKDYYAVLTTELPSQPWRESHVLCGGHSLGGPLTQWFAGWDFDGDKKTTADAGWRQCAAFVGFESMLDLDPTKDSQLLSGAIKLMTLGQVGFLRNLSAKALRAKGAVRHLRVGGVDPMSTTVMEAIAIEASQHPDEDSTPLMKAVPHAEDFDSYLHLIGSSSLDRLLFSKDSLRDLRFTNEALLGQLFDDNTTLISGVRVSLGYPTGTPLKRNRIPEQVNMVPGLNIAMQKGAAVMPRKQRAGAPITRWASYDELGSGATQIGAGMTDPSQEVTDIRDFSRLMYEGPLNFTDTYFPTRLLSDIASFYIGDRGGDLSGYKYEHPTRLKPRMDALGSTGVAKKVGLGSPDPFVMIPGYEHVDSITAAERQNSGQPEGSSQMLANMIDRVVAR